MAKRCTCKLVSFSSTVSYMYTEYLKTDISVEKFNERLIEICVNLASQSTINNRHSMSS